MSARITIALDDTEVITFGGRVIRPAASLHIEVDPRDVRAGHSAIAALAQRAHDELTRAAEQRATDQDGAA